MKKLDLTYTYYFNTYNGGQKGILAQQEFDRYIRRAERELLEYGFLEAEALEHYEKIRLCLCEVAEELFRFESFGTVKSESVDGYSVTYAEGGGSDDKIRRIILRRLGDTGLLFAGV